MCQPAGRITLRLGGRKNLWFCLYYLVLVIIMSVVEKVLVHLSKEMPAFFSSGYNYRVQDRLSKIVILTGEYFNESNRDLESWSEGYGFF